jgi:hypothetical protein
LVLNDQFVRIAFAISIHPKQVAIQAIGLEQRPCFRMLVFGMTNVVILYFGVVVPHEEVKAQPSQAAYHCDHRYKYRDRYVGFGTQQVKELQDIQQ